MIEPDHLGAVKQAAAKLRRAERAREQAQADLADAIRAAERAKLRPGAILTASGLPKWTYYRLLKGGQS